MPSFKLVRHRRQPGPHVRWPPEISFPLEVFARHTKARPTMANGCRQRGLVRHVIAYHDRPPPFEGGKGHQRIKRRSLGDVLWDDLDDASTRTQNKVIRTIRHDSLERCFDLRLDRRCQPVVDGD